MKDVILVKQGLEIPILMMLFSVIWIPNLINKKDYVIKESKIITLNKNEKGHIVYKLKKGRYRVIVDPGTANNVDQYIYGEAEEFLPLIENEKLVYEIDTDKAVEVFKQEYKTDKISKVKIKIEKLE